MSTKNITELNRHYIVDETEPLILGVIVYKTLEEMRRGAAGKWATGDTVEIKNSDSSLTARLDFGNANVTVTGTEKISPCTAGFSFADASGYIAVKAKSGKTLQFSGFGNKENKEGGVISVTDPTPAAGISLGDKDSTLVFESNSAENGGTVSGENVSLFNGTNTFTGNRAIRNGGAINGFRVHCYGETNVFSSNIADNEGGAIKGDRVSIDGGTNTFTGNRANYGGAIVGHLQVELSGGINTFANNSAAKSGGAITGIESVNLIGGTNIFKDNRAEGSGGAVWCNGKATFIAKDGNLTFSGNKQIWNGKTGAPNAIYMENLIGDETLNLAAVSGKIIELFDPVESSQSINLPIEINRTGADPANPAQEYKGTVQFDTHQSIVYGATNVHNGTMALTGGAMYGASENKSFILQKGATLFTDAKKNGATGNTIQAEEIIAFMPDSTLCFDMTGVVVRGKANATTNLTTDICPRIFIDLMKVAFAGVLPALSVGDSISLIKLSKGHVYGNPTTKEITYGKVRFTISVINSNELIATVKFVNATENIPSES